MLAVLAQRYPMKFTRTQLGTLAGYTASGGAFGAYFGALKRHGLIQDSDGEVQITRAGLDYLAPACQRSRRRARSCVACGARCCAAASARCSTS
jgi:hypothetical protein